jgi:hypothetical protein
MNAPSAATRAAKRATKASRGIENGIEIVMVELAGGIAASARLKPHFTARCADLP